MPADKDMCKAVTVRFSLLNPEHVRLLEQMETECRAGSHPLSQNKLIIRCIEEHYAMHGKKQSEEMLEERLRSYVDKELQKIKQEIGMEIYKDVFHMFTSGLAAGSWVNPSVSEIPEGAAEKETGQNGNRAEADLSGDADIMDEVMKWS